MGGPTMAERVARSSADLVQCPARHCWVVDSLDGVKRAALLLEWRRAAGGVEWEGRVVGRGVYRGHEASCGGVLA